MRTLALLLLALLAAASLCACQGLRVPPEDVARPEPVGTPLEGRPPAPCTPPSAGRPR